MAVLYKIKVYLYDNQLTKNILNGYSTHVPAFTRAIAINDPPSV